MALAMDADFETITLQVRDYIFPECTCRVEDMVKAIPHVVDASFDSINNVLTVKIHRGMASASDMIKELKKCKIQCEQRVSEREILQTKHEAMEQGHHEMTGMEHKSVEMKKSAAHDHHAMMAAEFKRHFIVAAIFTIPVLILSPSIQNWAGYRLPPSPIWPALLLIMASIAVLYGGFPFYKRVPASLRIHTLDMNVLVTIALLSGYLYSVSITVGLLSAMDFYWEISTLAAFLLFGHWMEMRAQGAAAGAVKSLVKLIPPTANLVKNGQIIQVDTSELKVGDIVLIKPGEKVPIDGIVIEGESSLNESMITGESKPVSKKVGNNVIGGTINIEGAIRVKVAKTGEETAVAQIIKMVEQAISSKPAVQRLADRAANYLTLIAIFVGGGTFIFWFGTGAGIPFALALAITVIVIACPHALGLAIPAVTTISTTMAANNGMLVKNAEALEIAKLIDVVVFDKTGTLTKGEFGVTDIVKLGNWSETQILENAAALEVNSEHVIAKGIVKKAQVDHLKNKRTEKFVAISGKGAKAVIGENQVYVGNAYLMQDLKISYEQFEPEISRLSSQGKTVVYVSTAKQIQGLIALADLIREESKEAIKRLKAEGLEVAMLTGDNKQTAAYVSKELDLNTFFAEVLPDQKANTIKSLQDKGKRVAMVGDGINDAPALVQSNVGIAVGAGTDVAVESADIVLIRNDPRDVAKLVTLSRKTMRKMNENLAWATGYNVIAIPIAAGILVPFGVVLPPEIAAITMTLSSISVTVNALLLRRAKI
ncbi:MAG TPA: copper-translocating P-type ATPase [Candidatus Sulfotelmatobacter sp.]|nr:copper-translocating P-type ATPase [Candidatus Sulfotelmatobacter sp.]